MASPDSPQSGTLTAARERAIQSLSVHFANDALSLEELEQRIEQVYRAATAADIARLTADLAPMPPARVSGAASTPARHGHSAPSVSARPAYPAPYTGVVREHDHVIAIMSETTRDGVWTVPQFLDAYVFMANATLDLRDAILSAETEIDVRCVMGSLRLMLPPHVQFVNHIGAIMGNVRVRNRRGNYPVRQDGPVVRITGFVCMGEVKVRFE